MLPYRHQRGRNHPRLVCIFAQPRDGLAERRLPLLPRGGLTAAHSEQWRDRSRGLFFMSNFSREGFWRNALLQVTTALHARGRHTHHAGLGQTMTHTDISRQRGGEKQAPRGEGSPGSRRYTTKYKDYRRAMPRRRESLPHSYRAYSRGRALHRIARKSCIALARPGVHRRYSTSHFSSEYFPHIASRSSHRPSHASSARAAFPPR